VPVLGALGVGNFGFLPAFSALVLYSIFPILRNTIVGLSAIDPALIDAARAHSIDAYCDVYPYIASWTELATSFETPNRFFRIVAPTHLVTTPALSISGRIGDRVLDAAPGHTARLWGKRHAQTWGWAHASTADGRWAHLLTVLAPPLPRASQHATERGGPGFPIARSRVEPPRVTVGPYVVDAPSETFIGLRYLDTDGSDLWCYHSERGHLRGAGIDMPGAAMEIAVRAPIAGWRVEA